MTDVGDLELVSECLEGNANAFGTLIDRYQKVVFNTALKMVNDYNDAQDIAQTVFVKAYEKLDTFNPTYKFFSWLYRMVVNESINWQKKKKYHKELDHKIVSIGKTPDKILDDKELSESLRGAIVELPIDYRVVIIFRHFEDLTYKEMGEALKIPEKTIKSRLFTARKLLCDILIKRGIVNND